MAPTPPASVPAKKAQASPLIDFLVQQRRGRLARLYGNAWTCEAVVRALPPHARHYVLRLVAAADDAPFARTMLEGWARERGAHDVAMQWLLNLSIVEELPERRGMLRLNASFREQLGLLLRGLQPPAAKPPNRHTPSAEELDRHAAEQWDQLLLCVVRPELWSAADGYNLPEEVLYPAGLVEVRTLTDDSDDEGGGGGDGGQPYWAMSQRGAAFVLEELSAQAWHILQVYIGDDERKLEFLLELAHMHFGRAYPLDDAQRGLIGELHHLGIVHVRDPAKSKAFYPTRLAAAIVSAGDLSPGAQVQGRTIVESNLRVYVYTQSRAWVEILRLFLRLRTLLPNAIVASITRERVQNAIREHGLTADSIINFLSRSAHEQVKACPSDERDKAQTVYDQIRLWERELERYTAKPAYYLYDFETHDLFDLEVAHAKATGTHMWHRRDAANSRSCKLVLLESEQTFAETRARIKAYKQSHGLS